MKMTPQSINKYRKYSSKIASSKIATDLYFIFDEFEVKEKYIQQLLIQDFLKISRALLKLKKKK